MTSLPDRPFSDWLCGLPAGLSADALRAEAGSRFRAALHRHLVGATTVTATATALGVDGAKLYPYLTDGQKHFPAAWLPLLPVAVLRPLLETLAARLGLVLRESEHDGDVLLHDLVSEVSRALADAAQSEADGVISVDEAERGIGIMRGLVRLLEQRIAMLERVRVARGRVVHVATAVRNAR